jgi:23S rRNA pseudouridine1911/1915/1917 synthase
MRPTTPNATTLFEDDALIVLAKPAGVPTANAPRGTASMFTLVQQALPRGSFLGVVSRLDAPVSGVLVFAKTRAAAADLSRQFRERSVTKEYEAVVEGRFPAPLATWVEWHDLIDRHDGETGSAGETAGEAAARAAHVRARVVRRAGEISHVELEPSTGRRHQLRLQLANRGCPIVGDRKYGARLPFAEGIALHARRLTIAHPTTGSTMRLEAPLPKAWHSRFPSLFSARAQGERNPENQKRPRSEG